MFGFYLLFLLLVFYLLQYIFFFNLLYIFFFVYFVAREHWFSSYMCVDMLSELHNLSSGCLTFMVRSIGSEPVVCVISVEVVYYFYDCGGAYDFVTCVAGCF